MDFPERLDKEHLKYIGRGNQGCIYLIEQSICIKVYKNVKLCRMESLNFKRVKSNPLFPKVYKYGKKYMIREYIDGIALNEYLKTKPLTLSLTEQLIHLFQTFKKLQFTRIDSQLQNIIITPEGLLRPIDLVNNRSFIQPYPRKMMAELEQIGHLSTFLNYLKTINKKFYNQWKYRYSLYKQGITSK